jgi:diguanylate cyclase (GGDEF)-like protein
MPPPFDARPHLTLVGVPDDASAEAVAPAPASPRPRLSVETPADAVWNALLTPPAPSGALVYVRLWPAPGSPGKADERIGATTADALRAAAVACAPYGTEGQPVLIPAAAEPDGSDGPPAVAAVVAFCGAFNMADLTGLRGRLEHALVEMTRRRGGPARAEVAGPYAWWLPGTPTPDLGDAAAGRAMAYPGDRLERLLVAAAASAPPLSAGKKAASADDPGLRAALQPVVSFQDAAVVGHEALCRGESGTPRERPIPLFAWAERLGRARDLDALCQRAALTAARPLLGRKGGAAAAAAPRLFVNLHPASLPAVADPAALAAAVERMPLFEGASRLGVAPGQVVAEVAERHAAADPAGFVRALRALRDAGFGLCLDDVSGGHLTLHLVAELAPDFVKTDRALVRAIDHAPARRALLGVVAETAGQAGTRLIAKGVETADELAALIEMGIPLGQGFYLAPPSPEPLRALPPDRAKQIQMAQERRRRRRWSGGVAGQTIGELRVPLAPGRSLRPEDTVGDIEPRVMELDEDDGLPVLDDAGRPAGLLMRRALVSRLAILYGPELLRKRHVSVVMDNRPVVIEAGVPVDQAVRLLLAWGDGKMDDHVLITDPAQDGACIGHVAARRLLEHVTQVQVRQARYANPLTGLPGNVPIEREVNGRLAAGQPTAVLYADLDQFKPYNDRYGVAHGDEVIRALSEAILRAVEEAGNADDFVGHLGGDDFLVVTAPDTGPALARAVAARFAERAPAFYTPEDRERGGMLGRDRYGAETFFPFVSVSVAGVGNAIHPLRDFAHVSERLGPLKAAAKAHALGERIALEGMDESGA